MLQINYTWSDKNRPTVLTAVVLLLLCRSLTAQTTNVVYAHPSFRIVGGQLYNTDKSIKFEDFKAEVLSGSTSNILLVNTYRIKNHYRMPEPSRLVASGNFLGSSGKPMTPILDWSEQVYEKVILLTNYPNAHQVLTGQKIEFKAMQVGIQKVDGDNHALYDYGTPNKAVIVSTNPPSKR